MADTIDYYEKLRQEFQAKLESILGSRNVYFQPPSNIKMKYPAIVYTRLSLDPIRADDGVHKMSTEYEVVLIDSSPNSPVIYKLARLPHSRHSRHFEEDNLNHDSFYIYY